MMAAAEHEEYRSHSESSRPTPRRPMLPALADKACVVNPGGVKHPTSILAAVMPDNYESVLFRELLLEHGICRPAMDLRRFVTGLIRGAGKKPKKCEKAFHPTRPMVLARVQTRRNCQSPFVLWIRGVKVSPGICGYVTICEAALEALIASR